jgi:hypothetical protein
MLTAHQLTKSYGLHTVLQNITFSISGPLLDRIDSHIEVPRAEYEKLSSERQWLVAAIMFREKKHRRLMSPMWRVAAGCRSARRSRGIITGKEQKV